MTYLFKIKNVVGILLVLGVCFFGLTYSTFAQTSVSGDENSTAPVQGDGKGGTQTVATPGTASTPGTPNFNYQPLVGIPGVSNGVTDFGTYINQLYFLAISLAALLAVIKIIFAGVQWMLTDIVTSKADAKKDIWGSLLGLLLIISAVLILGTINPNLTNLNVLSGAPMLRPTGNGSNGGATVTGNGGAQTTTNSNGTQTTTPTNNPGRMTFDILNAQGVQQARTQCANRAANLGGSGTLTCFFRIQNTDGSNGISDARACPSSVTTSNTPVRAECN